MRALKYLLALIVVAGIAVGGYAYFYVGGLTLRYHVKAGDVYRYKMTLNGNGEVSGAAQPIAVQVSGSAIYRIKIKRVEEDGEFQAEWREESGSMETTAMGRAIPTPPIPKNLTTSFHASPVGKLIGKPVGDNLARSGVFAQMANGESFSNFLGMGLEYPNRPIRIGGSWKDVRETTINAGGSGAAGAVKTRMTSMNRLAKLTTLNGVEIAQYRSSFDGSAENKVKEQPDLTMKGTQSLKCAMKTGMPISGSSVFNMEIKPKSANAQQTINFKFSIQMSRLQTPKPKKSAAKHRAS